MPLSPFVAILLSVLLAFPAAGLYRLAGLVVRGDILGIGIATVAGWGLVASLVVACVVWLLVGDPRRSERGLREQLVLAVRLGLAYPVRFAGLTILVALIHGVSIIGFVAILTISVGFVALVTARFVLPAADRFEGRQDAPPA